MAFSGVLFEDKLLFMDLKLF